MVERIDDMPAGMSRFVIQQHDASTMHFDFRLEVDGVLASWAVPKGPSTDPSEKRLAVQVGDHALDYASFEGVHEGGRGSGAVIVWDNGTYTPLTDAPMRDALDAGHASFRLDGQKLRGGYTLQRTHGGDKPQWLLIKRRDDEADAGRNPVSTEPQSVVSGLTIQQMATGGS